MWDSEKPLELLNSLPARLDLDCLKQLQQVIDVDKYINSEKLNYDLCGQYAPFCQGCNKGVYYPCAVSYVNMKKEEGLQVEAEVVDLSRVVKGHEEEGNRAAELNKKRTFRIATLKRK